MNFSQEEVRSCEQGVATFPYRAVVAQVEVLETLAPEAWRGDVLLQQHPSPTFVPLTLAAKEKLVCRSPAIHVACIVLST